MTAEYIGVWKEVVLVCSPERNEGKQRQILVQILCNPAVIINVYPLITSIHYNWYNALLRKLKFF
jgi:peptide deformylase